MSHNAGVVKKQSSRRLMLVTHAIDSWMSIRLEGDDEAEEGNDGGGASSVGLGGGALEGSGGLRAAGARGRRGSGVVGRVRSLNLAVRDLRGRGASGSLDLAIRDLGDGRGGGGGGGGGLNLAIRDLGDRSARGGSGSGGLNLTVGDLADGSTGGSLDLAVGDLRDGCSGGGGLDLTIRDLGGTGAGGSSTRRRRTTTDDVDGDVAALVALRLVVEVVEGTLASGVASQALVEDDLATKSERSVLASRPAGSVDGASLSRAIELELVVGGDVTGAVLGVHEDTILQGDPELVGLSLLPLFETVSMRLHVVGRFQRVVLTFSKERLVLEEVTLVTWIWKSPS